MTGKADGLPVFLRSNVHPDKEKILISYESPGLLISTLPSYRIACSTGSCLMHDRKNLCIADFDDDRSRARRDPTQAGLVGILFVGQFFIEAFRAGLGVGFAGFAFALFGVRREQDIAG